MEPGQEVVRMKPLVGGSKGDKYTLREEFKGHGVMPQPTHINGYDGCW